MFLLEDCIRNGELVFSANIEQETPISIAVTSVEPSTYYFPSHRAHTNSNVKDAKDNEFVICKSAAQMYAQIWK